jgi:hypothetical protein
MLSDDVGMADISSGRSGVAGADMCSSTPNSLQNSSAVDFLRMDADALCGHARGRGFGQTDGE